MKKISISLVFILFVFNGLALCKQELHKAAYNGNIEQVKRLLKNNPDPDERDSFGGTALHAAMFQKNMDVIKILIDYGFDVNVQGLANGYTPLHDAVWANNLEAVKILLKHGAKVDIKGKDGLTPYSKAKQEGKEEIVKYFNSKGIGE